MVVRTWDTTYEVQAPAKLNLHLEILARRPDGFHEIETLMLPVSLYDTLRLIPTDDGILTLHCRWAHGLAARYGSSPGELQSSGTRESSDLPSSGTRQSSDPAPAEFWRIQLRQEQARGLQPPGVLGDLPTDEKNIVYRALALLQKESGTSRGANVEIVKRIPSQAGLGGASADAAAALLAANEAWELGWSRRQLAELSSQLGSDIPFFFQEGAAICRGRGEQIESLGRVPPLHFVLVRPPEGLSTPAVYKGCTVPSEPARVETIQSAVQSGDVQGVGRALMNRLQEPAQRLSSAIDKLRETFSRMDFVGHQMSGSGSTYFGLCRSATQARRLAAQLEASSAGYVVGVSSG